MTPDSQHPAQSVGRGRLPSARIEHELDRLERLAGDFSPGPLMLGAMLAAGVIAGGIATFLLVWAILVGLLA